MTQPVNLCVEVPRAMEMDSSQAIFPSLQDLTLEFSLTKDDYLTNPNFTARSYQDFPCFLLKWLYQQDFDLGANRAVPAPRARF